MELSGIGIDVVHVNQRSKLLMSITNDLTCYSVS